jgi:hypothetical protein
MDPLRELVDERGRVQQLGLEVARVEVDPEARPVVQRRQRLARRDEVVGDLGRVHLEREAHALGVEDVDDRPPRLGEALVAALDLVEVVGRERVEHVPDRRAGEARHDLDAEAGGGAGGVLHPFRGACADAVRVAVAPDLRRHDRLVTYVDRIADGLPDEVVGDRPAAEAVRLEQRAPLGAVAVLLQCPDDVEVVAPGGQLEAVEAPFAALGRELGDRQVGPLAGEEGDGACHSGHPSRR